MMHTTFWLLAGTNHSGKRCKRCLWVQVTPGMQFKRECTQKSGVKESSGLWNKSTGGEAGNRIIHAPNHSFVQSFLHGYTGMRFCMYRESTLPAELRIRQKQLS